MRSSSSESAIGFGGMLAGVRDAQERRARELGYADAAAMFEAEESAEAARALRDHRRSVVEGLDGRLTDAMAEALLEGRERETQAVRAVREWASSSKPVLVLAGGVGTGKTVAALSHVCSRPMTWQLVRCARLGAMHERWSSDREDHIEALRMRVPLMILDDLGQEEMSDRRTVPALLELFDSRKSARTRTIVTTNLTGAQAEKRYPEPMIDRLRESARWIGLEERSMRRRQA